MSAADDKGALAKGAIVNLVGRTIGQGGQFALQVLLARMLGPVAFGVYSIAWIFLRIGGGLVAPLGLDDAVIRFAPHIRDRSSVQFGSFIRVAMATAMVVGAAIAGLVFVVAPVVARNVYHDPNLTSVLRVLAPSFALLAGLRIATAATRITQRMGYTVFCEEIVPPIGQGLLFIVLSTVGSSATDAAATATLSLVVAFGLAAFLVVRLFPIVIRFAGSSDIPRPSLARLLSFSIPTMVGGLALNLLTMVDQLLLGIFGSPVDVGIYRTASISAIVLPVVLGSFNGMVSSQFAGLHHEGHADRVASLFRVTARWTLYLGLPPFLVMCFAAKAMLSIFGATYTLGSAALIVLATAHLSYVAAGPAAPALLMTGSPRAWTAFSFAALVANIVLNLFWIPSDGAVGAALARAVALGGLAIASAGLVRRRLGFWPWDRRFLGTMLAGALTAIVLAVVTTIFSGGPLVRITYVAAISGGMFFALVALFGLDHDDRRILRAALRRVGL